MRRERFVSEGRTRHSAVRRVQHLPFADQKVFCICGERQFPCYVYADFSQAPAVFAVDCHPLMTVVLREHLHHPLEHHTALRCRTL